MADVRPRPAQALAKTLQRARARGPSELWTVARQRIREWVSSDHELVVLRRAAGGDAPSEVRLRFVRAKPKHGEVYADRIGTESPSSFRARLSAETHCFLVLLHDEVVHATWVTTAGAWTREIGRYIVPPTGDAYTYESFTRSEARGRGAYPFALKSMASALAAEGIDHIWVGVDADNDPSVRAITKAGFKEAFRIRYRRRVGRLRVEAPPDLPQGFLAERPP